MCMHSEKLCWVLILWTLVIILISSCDSTPNGHYKQKHPRQYGDNFRENKAKEIARTNIQHGTSFDTEANSNRNSKRHNVRRKSELPSRDVEDILLDEIKRSDKAANRAEVSYNIPKENEYFDTSLKAGDNIDTDTSNMIDYNEKKGAYLPVLADLGNQKDGTKMALTEQFQNITGLPDFLSNHKEKSNVSLVETVANSLQPSSSAFTGIKQLLEENKVEQSLKKGLDAVPNLEHSISPDYHNTPIPLDKSAINSMPFSQGAALSQGYTTPINPDEVFDEAVSPPEQLLDELSAGKFKHPLSDSVLNKMSNWNANKEYLMDNGYLNQEKSIGRPRLSRVSTDVMPVHDVYLKNNPVIPTNGIPKGIYNVLGRDPEVLGRNQEFLNENQFHSLSDLDSIGPPVYPAKVIHMPHHMPHNPPTHVVLPSKHIVAHFDGGNQYEDVDEGAHRWYFQRRHHHHPHVIEETEEPDRDEEEYLPHPKVHGARCGHKPCFNGGRCTALTDRYVCSCREGFTGINCERKSLCYPNPCRHGTCSSNPDNFVCTCTLGWQGKRCDEKDKCHPNPCFHGGTCTSTPSGVFCSCPPGYKGKYCETEAKCSPLNPCVNGGRCQEMPFTYICICKNGYAGRNCDAVLSPTSIPPTIPFKPVPPQPIPIPHDQPPFLLEELNSLTEGPLQEHHIPVMKFDTSTTLEDVPHHDHHIEDESHHDYHQDNHHHDDYHHDDYHYEDAHHDDHPQPISSPAAVIIHTGDPTKEPKEKKDDKKSKKKKKPPTDFTTDDRYQTHLVSAGVIKGKPADDDKTKDNPELKKPPIEKPEQLKTKPTEKEENRPKQLVPTAEILKRLQNPHPVENQVYLDTPKKYFSKDAGQLHSANIYARPIVKNKVIKGVNPKVVPASAKEQKTKSLLLQHKLSKPTNAIKSRGSQKTRDNHVKKPVQPVAEIICPGFCKAFCDKWCTEVGCCKQIEIKGPTSASNFAYENYETGKGKGKMNCLNCSDNADCSKGHCKCKRGFVGNGVSCTVDPCLMCDEHASCKSKKCECNMGYFGDGYTCKKFTDHCSRCSPSADCISNYCFCKPGYYGNGNDCWPTTDPSL